MMTISTQSYEQLQQCAQSWITLNGDRFEADELANEGALIILEGYSGVKEDGDKKFAIQKAAERLSRGLPELDDATGFEMDQVTGTSPSGVRNTDQDFIEQVEVDDWIETKLDKEQQAIVHCLLEGWTHGDIAHEMEVDRSTVTRKLKKIQYIAGADFDVN